MKYAPRYDALRRNAILDAPRPYLTIKMSQPTDQSRTQSVQKNVPTQSMGTSNKVGVVNQWLIPVAIALIFVGFLSVWMPNKAAGLAMLGLEIGEWVKFLPEVQAGQTPSRTLFYLPPLTLALAVLIWSAGWHGWQVWLLRLLALAAATLALPSVPDILDTGNLGEMGERVRVGSVLLVAIFTLVVWKVRHFPPIILSVLGLIGAIFPSYAYFAIRPVIASYLQHTPGVGYGLWLSLLGHLILIVAGLLLSQQKSEQ